MKIRIIDTTTEPNITGNVNLNDTKALQVINLFLSSMGKDINMPMADKLDFIAGEMKKYLIRVAKTQLRERRQIELEEQLVIDSNFD